MREMSTTTETEEIGLKMRRLIDRWRPTVLVLFSLVKFLHMLKKLGFAAKEDGWRRTARVYLRTEHSKFCLAAFRLDAWSDIGTEEDKNKENAKQHIIERLATFLGLHPATKRKLQWSRFSARREQADAVDIVHAEFSENGVLQFIEPHLDPHGERLDPLDSTIQAELNRVIVRMYNETRDRDDKKRPLLLKKKLRAWSSARRWMSKNIAEGAEYYIERVLGGVFIHFEELPAHDAVLEHERFACPDFVHRKHPGFGLLNILCRFDRDHAEADLWIQINHVPVDGVPMQDVLEDLKKRWGTCGDLVFPAPFSVGKTPPIRCSSGDGNDAIYHAIRFIDFLPFIQVRKELNERYAGEAGGDITVVSMLAWGLAHHDCCEDLKFTLPVDLPACAKRERTLGFVVIRPGIYFDEDGPTAGFLAFQREFNRRLRATRARRSESYELLETLALTPPFMYETTMKLMPAALAEITGTVGVTIIDKADLFIAPLSDTHPDGFIALGNFLTPTEDGGMAGAVSVKGSRDMVIDYLNAVEDVVVDFHEYVRGGRESKN